VLGKSTSNESLGFEKCKMAELHIIEFLVASGHISLARAYQHDASVGDRRTAHFSE
jgi:hypothetical protein